MWIAKPLRSLSLFELGLWKRVELKLPLAQTQNWANATEAVGRQAFVVFSPEEEVGGMVFCSAEPAEDQKFHFECINGPFLQWDDSKLIARQFATFALAVSKLKGNFGSLKILPRWEKGQIDKRVEFLPVELFSRSQASTLVVPIQKTDKAQFESISSRLRRTLLQTWKANLKTLWEPATPENLASFVPEMRLFGMRRKFVVPDLPWFLALTENSSRFGESGLSFWLGSSYDEVQAPQCVRSQILVCVRGLQAHYLFGYTQRSPGVRAAISSSALVQWEALNQCRAAGVQEYDLNGYLPGAQPQDDYFGVCHFKQQFEGRILNYEVPEFLIR